MKFWFSIITLLLFTTNGFSKPDYNKFFINKTCRLDYFHSGIATQDIYSLDQVYEEGEWAGSTTSLIDTMNLGSYLFKVFDVKTNQLLYSRGYSSVFAEWQTTDEAIRGLYRTMHETVRFPFPQKPVQVVIAKRNKQNIFLEQWSTVVDPDSRFINREQKKYPFKVSQAAKNGEPHHMVDIVIIGDGYTKKDMKKFRNDVKRYTKVFFNTLPFKQNQEKFNIWAIEAESDDSGIDEPRKNKWKSTVVSAGFNSFDSPRYVLTQDNKELRNVASLVPYDYVYILVNTPRYGGGGIYNWYATCYTGSENGQLDWWSDYVFMHEFGHSFAGLGDEYYTSDVAYVEFYPQNVEPWEPNLTRLLGAENLKWSSLTDQNLDVPTGWNKAKYDSLNRAKYKLSKSSKDYKEQYKKFSGELDGILKDPKLVHKVGCFEGAGYAFEGIYRPSLDCKMFSKSMVDFCPVCADAIEKMIDFHTK
jgi:hypothetical protein